MVGKGNEESYNSLMKTNSNYNIDKINFSVKERNFNNSNSSKFQIFNDLFRKTKTLSNILDKYVGTQINNSFKNNHR
jgi:hypothetical protein